MIWSSRGTILSYIAWSCLESLEVETQTKYHQIIYRFIATLPGLTSLFKMDHLFVDPIMSLNN